MEFKSKKVTDKRRNNKLAKQEHDEGYQKFYQSIQSKPTLTVYTRQGVEIDGKQKLMVDSETSVLIWVFETLQLDKLIDLNFMSSTNSSNVQSEVLIWYRSNSALDKDNDVYNRSAEVTDSTTNNSDRPFVYVIEKHWFIFGLSSILRFLLKYCIAKIELVSTVDFSNENLRRLRALLGFRGSCLQACAEVSVWTKFCEVDIFDTLRKLNTLDTAADANECKSIGTISNIDEPLDYIPIDLARFEYHLRRPVRIHNIRKEKQLMQQEGVSNGQPETADELEHTYAEGPYLLLSDVILYPCISTVMNIFGKNIFQHHLPRTYKWLTEVEDQFKLKGSSQIHAQINSEGKVVDLSIPNSKKSPSHWQMPIIPDESLYKSDPARYKPTLRLFTRNYDVKDALDSFSAAQISTFDVGRVVKNVNWDEVPLLAHPEGGQMPVHRREKKCQQLSSMVVEVLQVVEKKLKQSNSSFSLRIVDFCSGGGHVGILLAWLLPKCQIILVENKEESLRRGRERIERLGLTNITMYQCNLDYFDGHFDIGVALHACGTATDLVLSKCIAAKASFVCCPCCYGAIQSNHMLHYPRSSTFQASNISLRHYFILAHASDQTHDEKNEKTEQGRLCMRIIDTDRCLNAQDNGYQVHLTQIVPETASPKNHILVGINFTVK